MVFVYAIDVKWGIGHQEVELPNTGMGIFVVAVALPDVFTQPMDSQTDPSKPYRFG